MILSKAIHQRVQDSLSDKGDAFFLVLFGLAALVLLAVALTPGHKILKAFLAAYVFLP